MTRRGPLMFELPAGKTAAGVFILQFPSFGCQVLVIKSRNLDTLMSSASHNGRTIVEGGVDDGVKHAGPPEQGVNNRTGDATLLCQARDAKAVRVGPG